MGDRHAIRVFQTAEHPCGYWRERSARDLVLDPADPGLPELYPHALAQGFRRSGGHVYRPHCAGCRACIAVRIPVAEFRPDRSQRRCLARNADLTVADEPAERTDEIFELYRRYVNERHAGGGMDDPSGPDFDHFVACRWSPTRFLTFRLRGELLAVAVTDVLPDALSSVYTFFAPEVAARGLGTYAILRQVDWARTEGHRHVYLGFWLEQHPKMDYKRRFRPLEFLDGREWRTFPAAGAPPA